MPSDKYTPKSQVNSDSRKVLGEVSSILAEHYGIKLASLIQFTKSLNQYLPKENRVSETDIAKAIYGKYGDRRMVNQLLKKYGGAQ